MMLEPVCDQASGRGRCRKPATTFTIRPAGGKAVDVDLCPTHAEALAKLMELGRASAPAVKSTRSKMAKTEIKGPL